MTDVILAIPEHLVTYPDFERLTLVRFGVLFYSCIIILIVHLIEFLRYSVLVSITDTQESMTH